MPRVQPYSEPFSVDERAELVLEPGQVGDLVSQCFSLPVDVVDRQRNTYKPAIDSALRVMRLSASSPDVLVELSVPVAQRPRQASGGPWMTTPNVVAPDAWIVPFQAEFSLTAVNRSKETIRVTVYMQFVYRRYA